MSALSSIRKKCHWCSNGQPKEIQLCPAKACPFWLYRMGTMPKIPKPSPLKAVRVKCLDCVEGPSDVKDCTDTDCPIWPYRFGRNPAYSEASRNEARKRLATRRFATKSASSRQILERTTAGQEEATGVK